MMIYKNNMETEGAYGAYNADRHEWSGAGKPGSLLETTLNTRELGGYRTKSGACTGRGMLIRSDMQKAPSERDIAYLSEKRISTIIDMRGKRDVADASSPFAKMDARSPLRLTWSGFTGGSPARRKGCFFIVPPEKTGRVWYRQSCCC